MSIQLMTLTWQTALPLNQKAALLALSDWANDDGASLHPSIYALSERLTCSERTAQRLMRDLEEGQWIAVVGNHNGGRPGATRNYRINVRKLRAEASKEEERRAEYRRQYRHTNMDTTPDPFAETGDAGDTGVNLSGVTNQVETGDKSGTRRVTNQVETGDTRDTLTAIEPSKNHHRTTKSSAIGLIDVPDDLLSDWNVVRKGKKAGQATPTVVKGLQREARLAGLTDEAAIRFCCEKGWQGFRAEWYLNDQARSQQPAAAQARAPQETAYQQQMRQRVAALTPRFAAQAPRQAAGDFFREQAIDVHAHEVGQSQLIGVQP